MINPGTSNTQKGKRVSQTSSEEVQWLARIQSAISNGQGLNHTDSTLILAALDNTNIPAINVFTGIVKLTSGGTDIFANVNCRSVTMTVISLTSGTVDVIGDNAAHIDASYQGLTLSWGIDNPTYDTGLVSLVITVTGDAVVIVTYTY